MGKDRGNVGNLLVTGIFILTMSILMMSFLDNLELIERKMEVNQIARQYILRMETKGCLSADDKDRLLLELENVGVTNVDLGITTTEEVGYGERVVLDIKGVLYGKQEFTETRVSTAKY